MTVPTIPFVVRLFTEALPRMTRRVVSELEILCRGRLAELPFEQRSKAEQDYINCACDAYVKDGEIEIDEASACVSVSDDRGAYIQAWVWVYDTDVKEFKEKQRKAKKRSSSLKSLTFDELQQAAVTRAGIFRNKQGGLICPTGALDDKPLMYWSNAMAGEAGEAANVVKKWERGDWPNTPEAWEEMSQKLGSEIADTVIYAAILAARAGLNLATIVQAKFDEVTQAQALLTASIDA